jgi:hypothetical protein
MSAGDMLGSILDGAGAIPSKPVTVCCKLNSMMFDMTWTEIYLQMDCLLLETVNSTCNLADQACLCASQQLQDDIISCATSKCSVIEAFGM